jgi:hypothetical protein
MQLPTERRRVTLLELMFSIAIVAVGIRAVVAMPRTLRQSSNPHAEARGDLKATASVHELSAGSLETARMNLPDPMREVWLVAMVAGNVLIVLVYLVIPVRREIRQRSLTADNAPAG